MPLNNFYSMETIIFKAPKELKERVKRVAKKENRITSDMMRIVLNEGLKKFEKK